MTDLIFTNNVRSLRKMQNISQEKMALDLHIDRRTIGRIERCEHNPSLEVAYRISAYFGKMIPDVFPVTDQNALLSFKDFESSAKLG